MLLLRCEFVHTASSGEGRHILAELRLVEQGYQAVLELLEGASVTDVAGWFGMARARPCTCGWAAMAIVDRPLIGTR